MQTVRENPPPNVPPGSLVMLREPNWTWGVPGSVETVEFLHLEVIVIHVAKKCQLLWRSDYSPRNIAVLFTKTTEVKK